MGERKLYPLPNAPHDLAVWIAEHLDAEDVCWFADEHHLYGPDGLKVWISNGAWAVHAEIPNAGHFFRFGVPNQPTVSQAEIWDAFTRWQDRRAQEFIAPKPPPPAKPIWINRLRQRFGWLAAPTPPSTDNGEA